MPTDPYTKSRKPIEHVYNTPSNWDDLKKFLELDHKVLRFYAVWDDRANMFGELRPFVSITYVLAVIILYCIESNQIKTPPCQM